MCKEPHQVKERDACNFSGHIVSYFRYSVGMIGCLVIILGGRYYYLDFIEEDAKDEKNEGVCAKPGFKPKSFDSTVGVKA